MGCDKKGITNLNLQGINPEIVDDVEGVLDLRRTQKVKTKMENLNI